MATCEWLGNALAVAQVHTWTFAGTWEADDIVNVTINGKTISTVAGSTSATTIATTIYTALAASTIPEFAEIAWTNPSAGVVKGTANTAGLPFTCTFATTETGGGGADAQTINGGASSTGTVVYAATGPNHADNTANWSTAALPVDTDDVVIRRPVSILYGLTALASITPATLRIYSQFWASGARIGLPEIHGSGATAYPEYRSTFLQWDGATLCEIGLGEDAGGSSLINLDFGTGTVAATVFRTPQSSNAARPALCLIINPGTVANGTLEVLSGSVGVGFYNESCKCVPKIGYRDNQASDSRVYFGPNVTMGATFDQSGGIVEINTATTVITKTGGTLTINGTGAHPTVDNNAGLLVYNSTGTIGGTSLKVGGTGTLDYSQDMSTKTNGTTIQAYRGATILNPHGIVSSFAVKPMGCRLSDINLTGPIDKTWTPS
jgi:hypothetical protein